ncbi:MAG: 1,4-alpha-glucan branching protein GlgB [Leptolyngbyaceae bacterium]|nr:1,4-alpha-glucan branching protein GlgB [Leptolyngbyaceae bacterium]
MSSITIAPDLIDQIIQNQHHDPFEVLGPHQIEQDGIVTWAVRAYLPNADAAWVVRPGEREEYPMESVHHPHFFECQLKVAELSNYQLRVKEGGHERVFYDPYAFRSPKLTDFDIHLFSEGNHHRIYEKLGAHAAEIDGIGGVYFAVWAPNADSISIIGDFNGWDGRQTQMRRTGGGIWELFVPQLALGTIYKYEIKDAGGQVHEKADPFGFQHEIRPKNASIVVDLDTYTWTDQEWLERRRRTDRLTQPIAVYEVHLGSWLHDAALEPAVQPDGSLAPVVHPSGLDVGSRYLTYRELSDRLIPYVKELGFNYIELLPITEHPFDGSWGYQVTGYYGCTSRYGNPEDFMYFVDQCHVHGIGVIMDWVPGHFAKDPHGLGLFDGSHLYEHIDPRKGEHKEWGTYVFNYGRNEVRNFLYANALFFFDKYHIDGIRVDAVASMLYLNYNRKEGEWIPNKHGGAENIEAADFLRQTNHLVFSYFPGTLSIAEESTSWPMVSWPTYVGGLGFNLKWNMGWMHDMLDYFSMDAWFRQFHQNNITFSLMYAFSENFMLALSHDEVVHGKSHMIGKMHGDEWQKFAGLRCLYAYMYAHPGKKTLFMGMEFGQWSEWNVWADLEWHLLQYPPHQQLKAFISKLNATYRAEPALHSQDFSENGFQWIDCNDHRHSVVSFLRRSVHAPEDDYVIVVCNFTPQPHAHYRVGVPHHGFYREILNSDAGEFGGSNMGNLGGKWSDEWVFHNQPYSIDLCLPPLGVLVLKWDEERTQRALAGDFEA